VKSRTHVVTAEKYSLSVAALQFIRADAVPKRHSNDTTLQLAVSV